MTFGQDRAVEDIDLVRTTSHLIGEELVLVGRFADGETGGALLLRGQGGTSHVLTLAMLSATEAGETARVLSQLRDHGLAVPRWEHVVLVEDDVVIIQEWLRGEPRSQVTPAVIDDLIKVNESFAGLLRGAGAPRLPLRLLSDGEHFPHHHRLADHDSRTRALLDRIHAVGRSAPETLPGDDLVHLDFTVANVLFDGDQCTGIVDWNNGLASGDRRFGLIKLLFDLSWQASYGSNPDLDAAIVHLDDQVHDLIEPTTLRQYWAYWTLVMLHWTIGSGDQHAIDVHIKLGERGLSDE